MQTQPTKRAFDLGPGFDRPRPLSGPAAEEAVRQMAKQQRNLNTGAASQYEPEEWACALVRAAGASFTNAQARGRFAAATGTNGVTRTGAGVYTFTLSVPCPSVQCNLIVTVYNDAANTQASYTAQHTSDTVKTVFLWNNASPPVNADFDFDLVVRSIAPY